MIPENLVNKLLKPKTFCFPFKACMSKGNQRTLKCQIKSKRTKVIIYTSSTNGCACTFPPHVKNPTKLQRMHEFTARIYVFLPKLLLFCVRGAGRSGRRGTRRGISARKSAQPSKIAHGNTLLDWALLTHALSTHLHPAPSPAQLE